MMTVTRALLERLIDYAGLFPPAGLTMPAAVTNFAAYQRRPDHWALGRLVVPASRLPEFEAAVTELSPSDRLGTRWPVTALLGADPTADLELIAGFNERHQHGGPQVLSLEARAGTPARVAELAAMAGPGRELYLELPLSGDLPALTAAVKLAGIRAKMRAGGVTAEDFPAADAVVAFLFACAAQRLPFKATAGLHHPVRGPAPLTYEPGSPRATMFGYLNLLLAATLAWHGRPESEARALLTREERESLRLDGQTLAWGGVEFGVAEIAEARREFALAIGSCSFTEPLDEIQALGASPGAEAGVRGRS